MTLAGDLKVLPPDKAPGRLMPAQAEAWQAAFKARNATFQEARLEGRELTRWKYQEYMKDYDPGHGVQKHYGLRTERYTLANFYPVNEWVSRSRPFPLLGGQPSAAARPREGASQFLLQVGDAGSDRLQRGPTRGPVRQATLSAGRNARTTTQPGAPACGGSWPRSANQ